MKHLALLALFPLSILADTGDDIQDEFYIPLKDSIPEGFEHLERELALYDIFFNGRYLSSYSEQSPALPDKLTPELKQAILVNKGEGMIFSSASFVVHRDPHKQRISIWDKRERQPLKKSPSEPSLRTYIHGITQQQSGAKKTTYHIDNTFNVGKNDVVFSFSQYDENTDIRSAYYGFESDEAYWSLGILPNNSVDATLSYGKSLVGGQVSLNKTKQISRDPIVVTLTSPANVYILRGEQLLSSTQLSEGEQHIDTNELPSGTYAVTLRIEYLNGDVEEQERHLTRNLSFGDSWSLGQLTVGALSDQKIGYETPEDYTPFVAIDVFGLQTNSISSQAQLSFDEHDFVFSPTVKWLTPYFSSTTQLKIQNKGDWWYSQKLSSSFYDSSQTYFEMTGFEDGGRENHIFTLSHNQPLFTGSLVGSIYSQKETQRTTSYQLTYLQPFQLGNAGTARLSMSFLYSEEPIWQLRLTYGARINSELDYRLNASVDRRGHKSLHAIKHQNQTGFGYMNSEAYVSLDRENHGGYGVKTQINNNTFGMFDLQTGQLQSGSDAFVNTQMKTSFVVNENGLKMTGATPAKTGFIVDLSGHKGLFKLVLNNTQHTLKGGLKHIIRATPYTNYTAKLSNMNTLDTLVVDKTFNKQLRKGELVELSWQIEKIAYLAGQVTLNGEPLANTLIDTGISQGYTDPDGYISVEIPNSTKTLTFNNITCELLHINDNLLTLGETSCKLTKRKH